MSDAATWFDTTVRPHIPYLLRKARSTHRCGAESEDVVQETCLRAFRARHQFRPGSNARAWLLRILRNTFVSRLCRDRTRNQTTALGEGRDVPSSESPFTDPYEHSRLQQQEEAVDRVFAGVPAPYSRALRLYYEGSSYRNIAARLDIPLGTVMSRLHRGRRIAAPLVREEFPHAQGPSDHHVRQ